MEIIADKMATIKISNIEFTTTNPTQQKMSLCMLAGDMTSENDKSMDYYIKTIELEHTPKALAFLRRFFFRDEPLNHCIELIPPGENSSCVPLEKYSMYSIDENLSLMAISSSGSIVGIQLNGTTQPPEDTDEPDFIKSCDNPKFVKILKLLHHVDRKADVMNRYPGKKILDIKIISVDTNCRGKGIAAELFKKTMDMAKELNYDYIRCDCSSHFTAKLCKRLDFEKIYELKYKNYLNDDGKPVFKPLSPHEAIVTYIKKL